MKKRFAFILIVCLAAILVVALAACDPDVNDPLGPDDSYSTGTYTVTFDPNGADIGSSFLPKPITGVKYGDTIPEPKTASGDSIVLQKRGYTFDGWTLNNTEFIFGVTQIVGNSTIKAKFTAKKYYHIPDIYGTLSYDEQTDTFSIVPDGHAKEGGNTEDGVLQDSLGNEIKDDEGHNIPVPETDITLPSSAIGPDTTIYSTYNSTSPSRMAAPNRVKEDGSKDKFCFWFYLQEVEDEESGQKALRPVQFSEWLKDDAETVAVRSVTYSFDEPLHLYAMFESDLPKVTVEYYEAYDEDESKLHLLDDSHSYTLGKTVDEADRLQPDLSQTVAHQTDFEVDHWYFAYFTENEDEDGDPVFNTQTFVFDKFDENGNSTVKDATSVMDAAHNDDIPASELNFRPATLRLYASWVKKISVANANEFKTKLTDVVSASLATLNDAGASEDDRKAAQAALDEILTAKIELTGDIDLSTAGELAPLFDAAHPFTGTIDGGVYTMGEGEEKVLSRRVKIFGATIVGEESASLFGYVNGTVKNLQIENCAFKTTSATATAYLGTVASVCGGEITGCYVTGSTFEFAPASLHAYVGGIVGSLIGTARADGGKISECYAAASTATALTANGATIGGIAGDCGTSTSVSNATAALSVADITATSPEGAHSGLRIGGIAGGNTGDITACEATLTLTKAEAKGTALIGGVVGQNAGKIARSMATLSVPAEGDVRIGSASPLQRSALGGAIGLNEGEMINSYAIVDVTVTATGDRSVMIGGLVGLNSSSRGDSQSDREKGVGAINRCYSTGSIKVNAAADVTKTELYVGGMIGFNKHSKFARNFTLVNIEINYETQNTDLIHAGFILGALDKGATFTSGYYANECSITVNGTKYSPKAEEQNEEEGDAAEDETNSFDVYRIGTPRPASDFADATVLFGTNADNKQLGWVGGNEDDPSSDIWELKEGAELPTLVNAGTTITGSGTEG